MERDKMVEALAERLRFLCCTHVQGLDKSEIRPFEQSAGRTGWIMVAGIVADEAAMAHAPTLDALQYRLAAAEAECRAREEVQARLIRERNAAEAEAARARGLLGEAMHALVAQEEPDGLCDRIEAFLASRPEGELLGA